VLLVHYADLKADLPAEVARIASFLGIELPDGEAARVARACHIDRMREAALEQAPRLAAFFAGGARSFFFQGTNGRWQGVLDADDLALYDSARARLLEPECARWLERGLRG
jgi:aryl sulfotransferase